MTKQTIYLNTHANPGDNPFCNCATCVDLFTQYEEEQ